MKVYVLSFLFICLLHKLGIAQTEWNLSFDNWKQVNPPLGSSYMDIDGWWASVNDVKKLTGNENHLTAFPYTPAQHGNYAIRLKSVMALTTFIPGVVVTGTFSFQQQQLAQGKPFTTKISKLKGYYKYSPVNGDSGVAYVHLSKWNPVSNKRDTIAVDSLLFIENQSDWKAFEINLDFSAFPFVTPDSIVIRFVSSVNAGIGGGKVGSELIIDNLSIEYPVSNQKPFYENFSLFPNPFQDLLTIQHNSMKTLYLELYDELSKKILSETIDNTTHYFHWNFLQPGIYTLIIKDKQSNLIRTQKIIKK